MFGQVLDRAVLTCVCLHSDGRIYASVRIQSSGYYLLAHTFLPQGNDGTLRVKHWRGGSSPLSVSIMIWDQSLAMLYFNATSSLTYILIIV